MSHLTKKKYVVKEVLEEFYVPEGDQRIVQVVAPRGNNLHQVFDPLAASASTDETQKAYRDVKDGKYLVSMPPKFRKHVWIKRNDYVIVEPIVEGDKVKAEIVRILYKEQIKYIKQEGYWPTFPGDKTQSNDGQDLLVNPNRPPIDYPSSSESESEDEQDGEDREEESEPESD